MRAGLLQFAISIAQPTPPGQSGIGQFANSVAGGAQATGRVLEGREAARQLGLQEGFEERRVSTGEAGVEAQVGATAQRAEAAKAQIEASKEEVAARIRSAEGIAENTADAKLLTTIIDTLGIELKAQAEAAFLTGDESFDPFIDFGRALDTFRQMKGGGPTSGVSSITDAEVADLIRREAAGDARATQVLADNANAAQVQRVRDSMDGAGAA